MLMCLSLLLLHLEKACLLFNLKWSQLTKKWIKLVSDSIPALSAWTNFFVFFFFFYGMKYPTEGNNGTIHKVKLPEKSEGRKSLNFFCLVILNVIITSFLFYCLLSALLFWWCLLVLFQTGYKLFRVSTGVFLSIYSPRIVGSQSWLSAWGLTLN